MSTTSNMIDNKRLSDAWLVGTDAFVGASSPVVPEIDPVALRPRAWVAAAARVLRRSSSPAVREMRPATAACC